ncbi:MAG TPA: TRAP transporter small permease [Rhizobiaceae bacterium]|nr:TRAP transporter small permease [Rhizobiaceae bacterium]
MREYLPQIARLLSALSNLALWLAGIGLVLMTAFVAWQVWGRYVLNASPSWTEPASVMLMSWFIFLGSAVGVRENFHLGFDVLLYAMPKARGLLRTISDVVVMGFGIGMIVYGSKLVALTWDSTMPALGLPGGLDYVPIVAGGFLVALFSLERMVLRFAGEPVDIDATIAEEAAI